jgi:hypothetical protein
MISENQKKRIQLLAGIITENIFRINFDSLEIFDFDKDMKIDGENVELKIEINGYVDNKEFKFKNSVKFSKSEIESKSDLANIIFSSASIKINGDELVDSEAKEEMKNKIVNNSKKQISELFNKIK